MQDNKDQVITEIAVRHQLNEDQIVGLLQEIKSSRGEITPYAFHHKLSIHFPTAVTISRELVKAGLATWPKDYNPDEQHYERN